MADIFLCGNGTDTPTDITLRAATACGAVSTVSGAAPGPYERIAVPQSAAGLIQVRIDIVGVGHIGAAGTVDVSGRLTGRSAVHGHGRLDVAVTPGSTASVYATRTLEVQVHASGPDPTEDELLLLGLIG